MFSDPDCATRNRSATCDDRSRVVDTPVADSQPADQRNHRVPTSNLPIVRWTEAAMIGCLCPVASHVEVERDQLDGAVRRCLANDGVSAYDVARRDQDSVVLSARDQGREHVEVDSELLHDVE